MSISPVLVGDTIRYLQSDICDLSDFGVSSSLQIYNYLDYLKERI